TLTSTDPYYWTNHNDITVTAWWPYTAGETTPPAVKVKANQSTQKDFEGSDLIVADGQTVTYGNPTLRFTHRTARVTIVLTDYTEGLASVRLTGLSTEGDNPAEITPYDKGSNTYTAIVAPQSVAAGTTFITCTFTNGKTFVYKMKNATDWQAGGEYTYTVSLAAARGYIIEDDGSYTVTSADGLMNIAELVNGGKTDINITLDTDIDLTGKDWTPIGTDYDNSYKGTFDGGGHTITGLTFTTNDEYAGLFGRLNRAGTVKNVVMEGVQITSNQIDGGSIGGVVGSSWGTIENCSVSGSVSGTVYVGGVVGVQIGGSITGCSSSATVKGMVDVGGVAGQTNSSATLTACYATGNVIIEINPKKNIAGGSLVGMNAGISLLACYATGNVTSTGSSTGKVHIGGFLGNNYTTVTACYWKNNHEQGIGYNKENIVPEATKVDGTGVTWKNAVDAMNTALQNAGSKWRYELNGALPTLRKQ
ncbi:fimbrillin family protein, partial [Bacteroides ovatus]